MSRKAEQSEATREGLIAVARALFAEHGYAGVGTEEIVRAAGVTRGALYHHFKGKRELFAAVLEVVEAELTQRVATAAISASDPFEALRAGAAEFLDACSEPEVERISLIDAPSVLGWDTWREIGMRHGLGLVQGTLEAAMEAGLIARQPVRPLAHMLIGAIDEAAMLVARADGREAARAEVGESVDRLLGALRAP